ncbi:TIGR03767 family metallophosphoesterase [Actinotalea sp. Marseille-Q4924]|uniref:TIGR03767 family metallophosphoesterase n=1 Tax=Actinotalea sp. Marseille-Q4924 TaxID=2866571 RepID=UPI001CE4766C|nr:TIGR03767 family metallophosphoesterase [Actinotalea sp. Marseille-Q4924]
MQGTTGSTLDSTIRRGPILRQGSEQPYYGLERGPGEPHRPRTELAERRVDSQRRSLAYLAHLTDVQLIDVQSPGRLEALHRFGRRPDTALLLPMQRPQEVLAAHATEALVTALNGLRTSPLTGAELQLVLTTGDNVDNMQWNELQSFMRLLSGGDVSMDSGGPEYEGVQDGRFPWAWAPDDPDNLWGRAHGFPHAPGLVNAGLRPFRASGLTVPWLTCYGNHDGLVQGRAPADRALAALTVGHRKVFDLPPGPLGDFVSDAAQMFTGPAWDVTASYERRLLTREQFVESHFGVGEEPSGHGLTRANLREGTTYYAYDGVPGLRVIVLDTTNPSGLFEGSLDRRQLVWLTERLHEVHRHYEDADGRVVSGGGDDRLVVVASHHPRTSMTNDRVGPGEDPGGRVLGEELAATLARFPHVVAWVSGHIHRNALRPKATTTGGFWEITTSSVMDWPSQARLMEIMDNDDGTLSIVCTAVDHAAPLAPDDMSSPRGLASWHRELAANDPMGVGGFEAQGTVADRNVELVLPDPRARRSSTGRVR